MAWKIVNKKVFASFVFFCLLVLGGLSFGVYKAVLFMQKKNFSPMQERGSLSRPADLPEGASSAEEGDVVREPAKEEKQEEKKAAALVEYENTVYGYKIFFPEHWNMDNGDSSSLPSAREEQEDTLPLKSGGYTFWSNYPDINRFTPQDKPEDFRLLSLVVYEDEAEDVAAFAAKLGFVSEAKTTSFISDSGAEGFEYVQSGPVEGDVRISVIYAKDGRFFVFTPAFAVNDPQSSQIMEKIIRSFSFIR